MTLIAGDDRPLKIGMPRLLSDLRPPPRCSMCGGPAESYCEGWLCNDCYAKTHVRDHDGVLHHLTRGERPPAVLRSLERRRRLWE